MINGAHFLLYSTDAEADRAFLRDILAFPSIDIRQGWLIFKLPPSELAVHPAEEDSPAPDPDVIAGPSLYLMCDDLEATMKSLQAKNVKFSRVQEQPWGINTTFALPSGATIGLYEPKHPTALNLR